VAVKELKRFGNKAHNRVEDGQIRLPYSSPA